MKQIILSITISISALIGKAQSDVAELKNVKVYGRDSITIHTFKDPEGGVVKMLRYYTAVELLPIHIRARLTEKFSGYVPTAIIEVHDSGGVNYIVNLSAGTQWLQVRSSAKGRMSILHRYHNALLDAQVKN